MKVQGTINNCDSKLLDPRTKMAATIIVTQIMIGSGDVGIMVYVRLFLAFLTFAAVIVSGYFRLGIGYGVAYGAAMYVTNTVVVLNSTPGVIVVMLTGIISRLLPGLIMGSYLFKSTAVSDFIASMEKMHVPNVVTLPLSIMFRFIPAIQEEYASIKKAMIMREITSVRNPIIMLEYRLVPLLMSVLNIGNDLSVAAVSRGLGRGVKRTCMSECRLKLIDIVFMISLLICLAIYLFTIIIG